MISDSRDSQETAGLPRDPLGSSRIPWGFPWVFMISLGICAAVDLRWLVILSFSSNFILLAIFFLNTLNKRFLNKDLFIKSFSEGNSLNVLEISSAIYIKELFDSPLLTSFNSNDKNYIFRLASEDKNALLKISEEFLNQENIIEIKYLTG